jgi:4-deoxy-L-threo-5-hexosulose-uronate ketol-isomerase
MEIRSSVGRNEFSKMTTRELIDTFVVQNLFTPSEIKLLYWESDRTIIGSAVPRQTPLRLESNRELATDNFCTARELGILNLGGAGAVTVDDQEFDPGPLDCLYVGRGSGRVTLASAREEDPARFYLVSAPAHATHPTTLMRQAEATRIELGSPAGANQRTIFQYIHEGGIQSCQLVLGFTRLAQGSVWNTMPPHTHSRRSEVYLYFDLPPDQAVIHLAGPPEETRHLIMRSGQAVLSPPWSIHSGCGTSSYAFVWSMGGENKQFNDMDPAPISSLA